MTEQKNLPDNLPTPEELDLLKERALKAMLELANRTPHEEPAREALLEAVLVVRKLRLDCWDQAMRVRKEMELRWHRGY